MWNLGRVKGPLKWAQEEPFLSSRQLVSTYTACIKRVRGKRSYMVNPTVILCESQ